MNQLVIDQDAILRAFWHRGRKTFVEWTTQEIAGRAKTDGEACGNRLAILAQHGLVRGDRLPGRLLGLGNGWRLTAKGQDVAMQLLGVMS